MIRTSLYHSGQSGHCCAELPSSVALSLCESCSDSVRHGRHYNKTILYILDILDNPIQSSLTTEFTENSLFHHEVHEGKTKGLKQRKPLVSECMRRNRINPLTTCILFMNFMVKLPFLILHILSIPVKPSCFPSAPICNICGSIRRL